MRQGPDASLPTALDIHTGLACSRVLYSSPGLHGAGAGRGQAPAMHEVASQEVLGNLKALLEQQAAQGGVHAVLRTAPDLAAMKGGVQHSQQRGCMTMQAAACGLLCCPARCPGRCASSTRRRPAAACLGGACMGGPASLYCRCMLWPASVASWPDKQIQGKKRLEGLVSHMTGLAGRP